ncbi:claudin-like protein ZF-A9 [Denticeps clupeoides]|uniref:Claudin n=1 Tax=Denticeps clupeoides TaxID=299321 RepID=A0AAY4BPB9_9TELE|nr:claudin-like protein ZF-A9 [Denticeps clupeoides]
MTMGLQILGMVLGVLGGIGAILSCALPQWTVTAFIGNNIVTAQVSWEGLWMSCVVQSTGQMQCKVYDSMLALPQELQASRAILVIAILVTVVAVLAGFAGGKCTNCLANGSGKSRVVLVGGALFIVAGLLCLVPPSWIANRVISDFYNPLVSQSQKKELGAALFISWASAVLLLLGGGLICGSVPKSSPNSNVGQYKFSSESSKVRTSYA